MALTAERDTPQMDDVAHQNSFSLPVAAGATIYGGGMVCTDADGRAVPASATAGLSPVVGRAEDDADNALGGAGAINVTVLPGTFRFDNSGTSITIANRFDPCYAVDDEAVHLSDAGGRPLAGTIVDVDARGVWVSLSPLMGAAASSVPSIASGPVYHVRGASTANVAALATFTVANDGITFVAGERVLLKDQTAPDENGIYVVGTVAGGLAPLTRSSDFDTGAEVSASSLVVVAEGTAGAETAWEISSDNPIVVDTDNVVFAEVPWAYGIAGTMVAQTIAAADAGTANEAARIDHNHGFTTAVAAQIDCAATAAGAGVSTAFAAADHAHLIVAPGVPTAITTALTAAAAGAAGTFADSAHVHGMTAPGVPTGDITTAAVAAAAGASGTFADSAHVHAMTAPGLPVASAIGDAQVAGAAGTFADSDHVHAREAAAIAVDTSSVNAIGAGPTVSYSDHVHAEHAKSVRYVMTTNVPALGAFVVLQDGVTGIEGDLVLLANQTAADENGVYELGVVAGTAPLTRVDWMPAGAILRPGYTVYAEEGTLFASTAWFISVTDEVVVGTDAHVWYPECVTQTAILVAGTVAIATVPVLSATRTGIVLTRHTANTCVATAGGYHCTNGGANGLTAGPVGTAAAIIEATVLAGTINNADVSTLRVTVLNR